MSDLLNVMQRWDSLGLLEGLPIWEKEELAQIYDNATKLLLSKKSIEKIPSDIFNIYDNVYIPVCRRLYRRVGPNFDIETMMGLLLESVHDKKNELNFDLSKPEKNPVVEFCINFADSYDDEYTNKTILTDEEYSQKIDNLLEHLRNVLLDDKMVSYVNREGNQWNIVHSDAKKTKSQTRFWNQKIGSQLVNSVLSDINKGLN
jgi:hypothetical protein